MISSSQVKDKLINNPDLIIKVLEEFNFLNINYKSGDKEIKCSFNEQGKQGGVNVYPSTLYSVYYSHNIKGSIYDLLMYKSGLSFANTHKKIVSILGGGTFNTAPKKQLFGGVYKQFMPAQEQAYTTYNDSVLDLYVRQSNLRFYNDGICPTVQRLFGIMYSVIDDLIIIPWFDEFGGIVGVKARINYEPDDGKSKYFALQNFSKTQHLYGINVTRQYCVKENRVYVGEAEKFPQQMFSKGWKNCVAIGGHDIHQTQVNHLKYLAKEIVLMFDEDVTEEMLKIECEKFINSNLFIKNKVGYTINKNGMLNKKESPGDKSKEEIATLIENIVWYN